MQTRDETDRRLPQRFEFPRYGFLAIAWLAWVVGLMVWAVTSTGTQAEPGRSNDRPATGTNGSPPAMPEVEPPRSPDALREARRLLAIGDFAAAASAFEQLTQTDPTDGRAWFNLAYAVHAMGDLERAITLHQKAAEFPNARSTALYNLACAYALTGATDKALTSLEQAVEAGFGNTQLMESDPDLESIRQEERFMNAKEAASKNPAPRTRPLARREFDFWIGHWDVTGPKGKKAGENSIQRLLGGHLLLEQWTSVGGGSGMSLNYYDPVRDRWRQIWVDHEGGIIDVEGNPAGGAMSFTGEHIYPDGRTEDYRMTFTPAADGTVRQFIEQSRDQGKTWYTWFDGKYCKRDEPPSLTTKPVVEDGRHSDRKALDFWVGEWNVIGQNGKQVGINRIENRLGGHLIVEHWRGATGGEGISFNYYDPHARRWRQQWISDRGGLVSYEGTPDDGTMRFQGFNQPSDGARVAATAELRRLPDGRVKHTIVHSKDEGKTWSTYFDATYVPLTASP